jgi:hypothetical protein
MEVALFIETYMSTHNPTRNYNPEACHTFCGRRKILKSMKLKDFDENYNRNYSVAVVRNAEFGTQHELIYGPEI